MESIKYIIKDKEGIHARPASVLVAVANKYQSNITVVNKGKEADLKRIFGLMGLCVKSGEEIVVNIDGVDEKAACQELEACLKENL